MSRIKVLLVPALLELFCGTVGLIWHVKLNQLYRFPHPLFRGSVWYHFLYFLIAFAPPGLTTRGHKTESRLLPCSNNRVPVCNVACQIAEVLITTSSMHQHVAEDANYAAAIAA